MSLPAFLLACLLTPLPAAPQPAALQTGIQKIDSQAADPDTRLAVVSAMADALQVHRNHLILLRRETGQSYGLIFVQALQKQGLGEDVIAERLRALQSDIQRRIAPEHSGNGGPPSSGLRPVLSLNSGVDHSSAATFIWFDPEAGIDSKHASLVAGVPYYRDSSSANAVTGVGDAYLMGSLYGRAARMDVGASLVVGLPSGDRSLGLGAGKVTVDFSGTLAHAFERVRPFVSAGVGNSTFNFAYQRPYIADGNVTHFSGGCEFRVAPQLTAGVGSFGLIPMGTQVVYSRIVPGQASGSQIALPGTGGASGSTGGSGGSGAGGSGSSGGSGGSGSGGGSGIGGSGGSGGSGGAGGTGSGGPASSTPAKVPSHMQFLANAVSTLPATDLRDYGVNAWATISIARGATLNFAVARSVPFQLTTARVSLGLDLPRLLFPSRW